MLAAVLWEVGLAFTSEWGVQKWFRHKDGVQNNNPIQPRFDVPSILVDVALFSGGAYLVTGTEEAALAAAMIVLALYRVAITATSRINAKRAARQGWLKRKLNERRIRKEAELKERRRNIRKYEGKKALREFDQVHDVKLAAIHTAKVTASTSWKLAKHGPTRRTAIRAYRGKLNIRPENFMPQWMKNRAARAEQKRVQDAKTQAFVNHLWGVDETDELGKSLKALQNK